MSDATRALSAYRRALERMGETVQVRRFSGPPASRTSVDTPVKARVADYDPSEIVGAIVVGDRKVIMLAETVGNLLPVTTADRVVVRGKELAIKAVDDSSRRVADTLIALEIRVGG